MHEGAPHTPSTENTNEDLVEQLLDQFGPLRPTWEARVEDYDDLTQVVAILKEGLQKRADFLNTPAHIVPSAYAYTYAEDQGIDIELLQAEAIALVREVIANPDNVLGAGQTGRVFESAQYPGICYKFMYDMREYAKWNSVAVEAELLARLASFSVGGVRTPKPYFFIEEKDFVVLAMQKIEGMTVKEVCEGTAVAPKGFDVQVFMRALEEYVVAMHREYGVYHRDLHEGNVLVTAQGLPCVIDFNKSIHIRLPDEDPTVTVDPVHGTITRFTDDAEYLRQMQRLFKEHPPRTEA
jgi:tRNA A-37 threonylcarbamoyl transferase component Bud32